MDNKIENLTNLVEYYLLNKDFFKLKKCGEKTNEELLELTLEYYHSDHIDKTIFITKEDIVYNNIKSLSRNQREVINSYIEINKGKLTVRSFNALDSFLSSNFKITNFNECIFAQRDLDFGKVKNIGSKSSNELNQFLSDLLDFIENVSNSDDEKDLSKLKNRFFLLKIFPNSIIPNEILENESVFKLVEHSITKNLLFEDKISEIFKQTFQIYCKQPFVSLTNLAKSSDLTRERIRQIRNSCFEELFEKFKFVKTLNGDLLQKYGINSSELEISVDDEIVNKINVANGTNFSKNFICFLIYICHSDKFHLVGNTSDVLLMRTNNSKGRHNWLNFYIVSNVVGQDEFNFVDFVDDLNNRISFRIEEAYSLNFNSYLTSFLKDGTIEKLYVISNLAERIMNQEFQLFIDVEDNINFERSINKQAYEYAYEALESIGEPSCVSTITQKIKELNPEYVTSEQRIRSSMKRKNGFLPFGRKSIFGLKKWENERNGIKGGTIKEIVFDYLQSKSEPVHVYELLIEVHKYREATNAKNIITNLKLDPQKQFKFFNQNFIGLEGKSYNTNLSLLPKFLGKDITGYLRKEGAVSLINLKDYFCNYLEVSSVNMNYIVFYLIDGGFIKIDEQQNLYL